VLNDLTIGSGDFFDIKNINAGVPAPNSMANSSAASASVTADATLFVATADPPAVVNWVQSGKVTPVRDQGNCAR